MNTINSTSREDWLTKAANMMCAELFAPQTSIEKPAFRVTVAPMASKHLGECYPRSRSADNTSEIFITAHCDDSALILATLVHELVHAYDDCQSGHKGAFKQLATSVGLTGKMTATTPTDALAATLAEYVDLLGPIPHAAISKKSKDKGRNGNKMVCDACDFKANLSAKWASQISDGFECPVCRTASHTRIEIK